MDKARFDDYIRRFNAKDMTAFDDYIHPDLQMVNGNLEFRTRQGMKDHYNKIWKDFTEELTVTEFISTDTRAAIQMWAHFTAQHDAPDALFGPVRKGDCFDYRGIIMYWIEDGMFRRIQVAYNSFTSTTADGVVKELGIVH